MAGTRAAINAEMISRGPHGPRRLRLTDEAKDLLVEKGWEIRRIKVDGGCYEVYALNEKGERVEAYFHPQTLEPVPTDE